jgi:hypothetical protein
MMLKRAPRAYVDDEGRPFCPNMSDLCGVIRLAT